MSSAPDELRLIPYVYAGDLPADVSWELESNDVPTHGQSTLIDLEWTPDDDDDVSYPVLQAWLVATYGDSIRNYTRIGLGAT